MCMNNRTVTLLDKFALTSTNFTKTETIKLSDNKSKSVF